jgi:rSAM/selenodomain-associated transferase 2
MMRISVVIPVLNEAETIAQTLRWLRQAGECQAIVVDGGSSDETAQIARAYADIVLTAPRGRARQMNVGAHVATGDVLLFLHADTTLPQGFSALLKQALQDSHVVGGRFDVRLGAEGWPFRMIERLMNTRSRLTRISTGDQAIFVRRQVFLAVNGYPDLELMEDLALSRKLKRIGQIACLRAQVTTSARRWQRDGIAKTIMRMWMLRFGYFLGVPSERLRAFYADTR